MNLRYFPSTCVIHGLCGRQGCAEARHGHPWAVGRGGGLFLIVIAPISWCRYSPNDDFSPLAPIYINSTPVACFLMCLSQFDCCHLLACANIECEYLTRLYGLLDAVTGKQEGVFWGCTSPVMVSTCFKPLRVLSWLGTGKKGSVSTDSVLVYTSPFYLN